MQFWTLHQAAYTPGKRVHSCCFYTCCHSFTLTKPKQGSTASAVDMVMKRLVRCVIHWIRDALHVGTLSFRSTVEAPQFFGEDRSQKLDALL